MNRATEQARQPAGGATPLSPQAVSAEGAHQAQFTPGVWFAEDWSPREMQICSLVKGRKVLVTGFCLPGDAQRIVAAPALLAALSQVVSDCQLAIDCLGNSPPQFDATKRAIGIVRDRASAAIAKATIPPAASAQTGQAQGNVAEAGVSQGTSL